MAPEPVTDESAGGGTAGGGWWVIGGVEGQEGRGDERSGLLLTALQWKDRAPDGPTSAKKPRKVKERQRAAQAERDQQQQQQQQQPSLEKEDCELVGASSDPETSTSPST